MHRQLVTLSLLLAAMIPASAHADGFAPASAPAEITNIESDDQYGNALSSDGTVLFARRTAPYEGHADGWWLRLDVRVEATTGSPVTVTGFTVDTDVTAPEDVPLAEPVQVAGNGSARIKLPGGFGAYGAKPQTLGVRVKLSGYASQPQRIVALAEGKAPTASGGYRFPGSVQDLPDGAYWSAGSHAHNLTQRYAYDFVVRRWNAAADKWTVLTPASVEREAGGGRAAGNANSDYLIWELPVYAPADATIVRCHRSVLDNVPGQSIGGGGNTVLMDMGDGTFIAYYHLRQFSVPPELCPVEGSPGGDDTPLAIPVQEGQYLGLVGNSGHSSAPHLHEHRVDSPETNDSHQRGLPLPFRSITVHKLSGYNPETQALSQWEELSASESGVPVDALIQPPCGGPGCFLAPAP